MECHEGRKIIVTTQWNKKYNRLDKRLGPIAMDRQTMTLKRGRQREVFEKITCWPVIRYRPSWRIMGRVNVHDKMHGMRWL